MVLNLNKHNFGIQKFCLYDADALNSVLMRMCADIVRLTNEEVPICLIGVLRRGAPLADQLFNLLNKHYLVPNILRLNLKVKRYNDDLSIIYPNTHLAPNQAIESVDLSMYSVFIVDDVLYRGYSALKVLEYLTNKHPISIHTVFLVDRMMLAVPIRANVVGVTAQVHPDHVIECSVPPYEAVFQIDVVNDSKKNVSSF